MALSAPTCHPDLLSGEAVQKLLSTLADNHILKLLYDEHVVILKALDQLQEEANRIRQNGGKPVDNDQLVRLQKLASILLQAEPHHQREENVLFPELEGRGIYGPPHVMRAEHVEIRQLKHDLEKAASGGPELHGKITGIAEAIVGNLRMHIHKENEILYPMAYDAIKESQAWDRLTAASDKIGPSAFMSAKS